MSTQAAALPVSAPVDAVLAELRNRLSGSRFQDAERLVGVFFRRVPADELAARPPAAWAALLCGMLDLVAVRLGENANVRVFNPALDEHILGAITLVALALVAAGSWWGLGRWWSSLNFVRKYPWLQ